MSSSSIPGRLALVSHRFQRNDGQGRVSYEIVKAALARGFHVTLVATHCADDIQEHPNARFVQVGIDRIPTTLLRNLYFAFSSARWLRRHSSEFDLVQTNGFVTWANSDVAVAHFVHTAWATNELYPYKGYRPYALYQRLFTKLNARWERRVYHHARRVVAVSKLIELELAKTAILPQRIVTIPNGVDTDQFSPGPPDREQFHLPAGVPVALFIGDLRTARKNLETVLLALQRLPGLVLAVVGDTHHSPYPQQARELGLAERVHFIGRTTQIPTLMRSSDLFLFPSRYDPFGLVVLEAMASGTPVIASTAAGATDYVGAGGLVLKDMNDPGELADHIRRLLQSPNLRHEMAAAGRERALTMQWGKMAEAYLELYTTLLRSVNRAGTQECT